MAELEEPLLAEIQVEERRAQNLDLLEQESTGSSSEDLAVLVEDVDDTEDDKEQSKSFGSVTALFGPLDWILLVLGILSAIAFGAVPPLQAKLLGSIFSGNAGHATSSLKDNIEKNVPKLLGLGVYAFCAGYLQNVLLSMVAERTLRKIKAKALDSLLTQEIEFYDKRSTGQLSTMLSEQSQVLLRGFSDNVGMGFQFTSQMVVSYFIAFHTNAQVAGTLMAVVPILSILVLVLIVTAVKTFKKLDKVNEESGGHAEEKISAIQTVAAFTGENQAIAKYEEYLVQAEALGIRLVAVRSFGVSLLFVLLFSTFGFAYWFGSTLIAKSQSDFGSVLTTVFTCVIGAMSIGVAVPVIQALAQCKTAVNMLFTVIDREPRIMSGSFKGTLDGPITFKDVCFSYPGRSNVVLNNVNFRIEQGQTVGLAGPSGCGKSTICSILERFYEPSSGVVQIADGFLHEFDLTHLRKNISLVSQEPILFSTSIAENIWLGMEGSIDMERVIAAAKMANAHQFIESFPDQYATQVGSLGNSLSGGQRQRVVIARAIIRDPSILLLDEATSALDSQSQLAVQKALDRLLAVRERTTIVIAHRLSTLEKTDRILVFGPNPEGGSHIVETGSHRELIEKADGVYRGLWEAGGGLLAAQLTPSDTSQQEEEFALGSGIGLVSSSTGLLSPDLDDIPLEDDEGRYSTLVRSASMLSAPGVVSSMSSPAWERSSPLSRLRRSKMSASVESIPLCSEEHDPPKVDSKDVDYPVSSSRLWAESAKERNYVIAGILGAGLKGAVNPATSLIISHAFVKFILLPDFDFPWKTCEADVDCDQGFCAKFFMANFSLCASGYIPGHTPNDVRDAGKEIFLLYGVIGLFLGMCMLVNSHGFGQTSQKLTHRLKARMFSSYMRMDAAFFDEPENQAGVLVARLATDPILVQNVTADYYGLLCENGFAVLVGLVIAFSSSWKMTLVILAPCTLLALSSFLGMRQHAKRKVKTDTESGKIVNQALTGIRTVYSCSAEKSIKEFYKEYLDNSFVAGIRNANVTGLQNGLAQCLFQVVYAFSFWYGAQLIDHGLEPKALSRVFFVVTLTAQGVGQSFARANDTSKASYAISRIYKLLDDKRPIDPSDPRGHKVAIKGKVTFDRVSFAYPTRPSVTVLKRFDLEIEPGETVAFCGHSGSGKSTLAKLLVRFYDPTHGAVRLDDVDLRVFNLSSLREQISIVDQQPILFSESILDNVAFGIPEEKRRLMSRQEIEQQVEEACKLSNAHDFIMSFPGRYNTPCGAKGTAMSGGQRQRIAIARALIKNPTLLILDEATAALDNQSEKEVQNALDQVVARSAKVRTTLIIAHRMSTVRNASRIVVLHQGKIIEQGVHEDLIKDTSGAYFRLHASTA